MRLICSTINLYQNNSITVNYKYEYIIGNKIIKQRSSFIDSNSSLLRN